MKHLKKHAFLISALLWTCIIFIFSLQSGDESLLSSGIILNLLALIMPFIKDPDKISLAVLLIRKTAHFTEYFILGFFYTKAATESKKDIFLVAGCFIPILDEGLQLFSPGRVASPIDMMIDLSGYLTGLIVCGSLMKLLKVFRKK